MVFYVYADPEIFLNAKDPGQDSLQILVAILRNFVDNCFLTEFEDYRVQKAIKQNVEDIPDGYKEVAKKYHHIMVEKAVELEDSLIEKYLESEDKVTAEELISAIRKGTIANKIVPVLCGSAFKNKGVQRLLDAITLYLPAPSDQPSIKGTDPLDPEKVIERFPADDQPFSALAFKVQTDPHMGKLVYFRVYSGKLDAGSYILNVTKDKKERVGRILQMHANERESRSTIYAGDIAAIIGLDHTVTGDTLSSPDNPVLLEAIEFPVPVMSISARPQSRADQDKISKALLKLAEEDPTFTVHTDSETDEMIISRSEERRVGKECRSRWSPYH